jgi:hypothetical protein
VNVTLAVLTVMIAIAAAARSTWSPCGQSMLSQINPIAEAGRGQRYRRTAGWFVAGATAGGLCLGGVCAGIAALVARSGLSSRQALAAAAAAALAAAVVDARLLGFGPPFIRRQVNEVWLTRYRSWVYGSGFGWQIGVGFTTYVMTAAVPLTVVLAVLTAEPVLALAIGTMFGLARGSTVFLSASSRTQDALFAFHRRFAARGEALRRSVIVVQLVAATVAAWAASTTVFALVVTTLAVALTVWTCARGWADRARRATSRPRLASDM